MNRPSYIENYEVSTAFAGKSRLVYGTSGLGGVWGKVDPKDSVDALLYAFENGVSVLDTAPSYANAELYVGQALKQWNGKTPFISTKVGRLKSEDAFEVKLDYSKEGMTRSVHNSLETLGLDCIDLLFLHEPHLVPKNQIEIVIATLLEFKAQGLVGMIGVGGNPNETFMPFVKKDYFDVVSCFLKMDACNLSAFKGEIQNYQSHGIAYYAASALHFGLLGNRYQQYQDKGLDGIWITKSDLINAQKVKAIADRREMPLATLAQRYLFSIKEADRVVMGAKNLIQIQSTISDWKLGKLDKATFEEVTDAILETV